MRVKTSTFLTGETQSLNLVAQGLATATLAESIPNEGGVQSRTDTTVTVTTSWTRLEAERIRDHSVSTSAYVKLLLDSTVTYAHTTNQPSVMLSPFVQLKSAGASKTVDVDFSDLFVRVAR